jgi:hypothetical protein
MQERKPNKLFIGILLFSILLCIPTTLASESGSNWNNPNYPTHPYLDHIPMYSGPYATQDTTPSSMTLPPTPAPTFETTMTSPSPRVTSSYNQRSELFTASSTLIRFLQNSSYLSQGSTLQNTITPKVTPQIPDSSPVILPVYSINPNPDQKRFETKLLKIQIPTSQPFVINTKTPLLPSNSIPQESTNFDEILRAYERNLTPYQLKLEWILLELTDPSYPFDNIKKSSYDTLISDGTLIPANKLGTGGLKIGDIIHVSIYLNPGGSPKSIEAFAYKDFIYDKYSNSVAAWVPLKDINKIAELDDVWIIDCPIAAINY